MWRSSEILGSGIRATDGSIGSIDDLLIDEEQWTVRWVVVDTGTWLSGRKVLLSPSCFGRPDPDKGEFPVELTRQKIKESPGIDADAPVSRQLEEDLHGYYGLTPYWHFPPVGAAGAALPPGAMTPYAPAAAGVPDRPTGDPHLRSANELKGYYIGATDDDIGHVEEFLVDQEGWAIRYAVVDTGNWWPGKKVLIAPQWVRDIRWSDQRMLVELTREQVKESPEYVPHSQIDRDYERRLYGSYGFPPYWV